jgi:hypothetical protein
MATLAEACCKTHQISVKIKSFVVTDIFISLRFMNLETFGKAAW